MREKKKKRGKLRRIPSLFFPHKTLPRRRREGGRAEKNGERKKGGDGSFSPREVTFKRGKKGERPGRKEGGRSPEPLLNLLFSAPRREL